VSCDVAVVPVTQIGKLLGLKSSRRNSSNTAFTAGHSAAEHFACAVVTPWGADVHRRGQVSAKYRDEKGLMATIILKSDAAGEQPITEPTDPLVYRHVHHRVSVSSLLSDNARGVADDWCWKLEQETNVPSEI
jgi:hypothetical protein